MGATFEPSGAVILAYSLNWRKFNWTLFGTMDVEKRLEKITIIHNSKAYIILV